MTLQVSLGMVFYNMLLADCRAKLSKTRRLAVSSCRQALEAVQHVQHCLILEKVTNCAELPAEFIKDTPYRKLWLPVSKFKSRYGKGK